MFNKRVPNFVAIATLTMAVFVEPLCSAETPDENLHPIQPGGRKRLEFWPL